MPSPRRRSANSAVDRFPVGKVLARIRTAVRPFPKAAMFALAEEGHRSVFRQLVACILSIRTRDETSIECARALFRAAPTAAGNRWGYVREPTPEATMHALQRTLPRRYWVEINALLVPFGKHICTGRLPRCSTCPVLAWCRQVGVTVHR